MIHYKAILKVMGGLMMLLGILMFPSIAFSYYYQSGDQITLIGSALVCKLCVLGIQSMLVFNRLGT